jgi:hypothetical protein
MANGKVSSYQLMQDVYRAISRVEDKLDAKLQAVDCELDDVNKRVSNMEGRASVLSVGISIVVSAIISLFKK